MQIWLAGIVAGVLIAVGFVHLYWLFEGRRGFAIAVPARGDTQQPLFIPRRPEIALVI